MSLTSCTYSLASYIYTLGLISEMNATICHWHSSTSQNHADLLAPACGEEIKEKSAPTGTTRAAPPNFLACEASELLGPSPNPRGEKNSLVIQNDPAEREQPNSYFSVRCSQPTRYSPFENQVPDKTNSPAIEIHSSYLQVQLTIIFALPCPS